MADDRVGALSGGVEFDPETLKAHQIRQAASMDANNAMMVAAKQPPGMVWGGPRYPEPETK